MTILLLLCMVLFVQADLPVHCLYNDVHGNWTFYMTPLHLDAKQIFEACPVHAALAPSDAIHLELAFPNLVKNDQVEDANGTWTLVLQNFIFIFFQIYDQGFEISYNKAKFFAFFNYTTNETHVTSYCGATLVGWYHPAVIQAPVWGCFYATKREHVDPRVEPLPQPTMTIKEPMIQNNDALIDAINSKTNLWKAKRNENLNIAKRMVW